MSAFDARRLLTRTMLDDGFLYAFLIDPEAAMDPYALTEAERAALKSGDQDAIQEVTRVALPVWWPKLPAAAP